MATNLPSQLVGNSLVRLEFPVGAEYDRDVAALLSNEEAMEHLLAMANISSGGWSEADAASRRMRQEEEFNAGTSLNGVVLYDNKFAGIAGYRDINSWNKSAEIGIIILPAYWRKGISTQVHFLCLEYAFEYAGINRVEFKTASSNVAMRKFCSDALHATHEGTMRDFFPSGTEPVSYVNVELYSLLSCEWSELRMKLEEKLGIYSSENNLGHFEDKIVTI
jgi:RimJ/RimL family protein N-acetyltransferase